MNTLDYLERLEREYPAEYLTLLLIAEETLQHNPDAVSEGVFGVLFERIRADYQRYGATESSPHSHSAKQLLERLEAAHKHFSDETDGNPYYRGIYLQCLAPIVELRAKNAAQQSGKSTPGQDDASQGEIATAIGAVVGVAMLKSAQKPVEKATEEAVRHFTLLFKVLGELMLSPDAPHPAPQPEA